MAQTSSWPFQVQNCAQPAPKFKSGDFGSNIFNIILHDGSQDLIHCIWKDTEGYPWRTDSAK